MTHDLTQHPEPIAIEIQLGIEAFLWWIQGVSTWDDIPEEPACDRCGSPCEDLTKDTTTCEGHMCCPLCLVRHP